MASPYSQMIVGHVYTKGIIKAILILLQNNGEITRKITGSRRPPAKNPA